jgi:hypothetical protein
VKVRRQCTVEENWISGQVAHTAAEALEVEASNILASDANSAAIHVVDSGNEFSDRALAGAVIANKSNLFTGPDFKSGNVKHVLLPPIAKLDAKKITLRWM